ncbi:MAG: hypothetical protein Q9162_003480 [Coniocarpon cinnabarinum]
MPLTAAELSAHPEFPHVIWDLQPKTTGRCPCGPGRGGPYDIFYELHGSGPEHILFIMGLGGLKTAWQRQSKDFGHDAQNRYSVLVFDNIGIGQSGKPYMRYTTSNMARDVQELLDHVGWTEKRSVHVVGVSMGGAVAQEFAMLEPERVATLTLVSTWARLVNTVGFVENLRNRINLFIPKSIDAQLEGARERLYSREYLEGPDALEYEVEPFPTGADRFGATELWKRQRPEMFSRVGFMLQAIAAGWHYKSAEQLTDLAEKVGRKRIQVMHGSEDKMISPPHGKVLAEELNKEAGDGKSVRYLVFEGLGHSIPIEKRAEFHNLLVELMDIAKEESLHHGRADSRET